MQRSSMVKLAVLAAFWGSSFLFIKIGLEGFSPTQIVLARLLLGAAVLAGVLAVRGQRYPRSRAVWGYLVGAAVFGNVLPYFSFAWAEQHVASNVAGVLNASTPLFTFVLALAATSDRRASFARAAGLVIGFAGVLVILSPWQEFGAGSSWKGQLACLVAALSYGISYIYISRFLMPFRLPSLVLAASQLLTATVMMVILAPFVALQPVHLTWGVAGSMVALGALGTGFAYILMYSLIGAEGPTATSTVTYLIPIVAVVLGVAALGEPLTWNLAAGTAIILGGVALTNRPAPGTEKATSGGVSAGTRRA